jgi:hypothetical protein
MNPRFNYLTGNDPLAKQRMFDVVDLNGTAKNFGRQNQAVQFPTDINKSVASGGLTIDANQPKPGTPDFVKALIGAAKQTLGDVKIGIKDVQEGVRNTPVLNTAVDLTKGLVHGLMKSGASVAATLANKPEITAQDLGISQKTYENIYGKGNIKSISTRIAEGEQVAANLGIPTKGPFGTNPALASSFGVILGITGLDFSGVGGEEQLAEKLLKETSPEITAKLLSKIGVSEELISKYAKVFAEAKSPEDISHGIKSLIFDSIPEETKLAQKGVGAVSEATSTEAQLAQQASTEASQQLPNQVLESTAQQTVPQAGEALAQTVPPTPKKSIVNDLGGAVGRLSEAIKSSALPARGELDAAYTAERARRTAALASVQESGGSLGQQLGTLKGELATPAQKSFEKVNLIEQDVKNLFKMAIDNPNASVYEKLNTQIALSKVLNGVIPTRSELSLLQDTYGMDLVNSILEKQSTGQKVLAGLGQLINLPRSIMSSFDMSAPFRQGLALLSHPKAFGEAFVTMFKQFGSEEAFKAVNQGIKMMPDYGLMKEGKLALTDVGRVMSDREEAFMSNWAEKIPGVGRVVRASGRAYTGFLNKLRADVFTEIINGVRASGRELKPELVSEIADFVNVASGRGSKLFGHVPIGNTGPLLNGLFFSPRLMASRTTLLNPIKYVTADPVVRKEMLKSLFTVLGSGMTMLGIAKMSGAKVGTNPTSSDFGKIIAGNTRLDIWGGFQQYVRMAAQLVSGKYTSTTTGKQFTLGEGYKPVTRWDILWRQIESKEAPIASFVTALLKQQDYKGDPVNVPNEVVSRFIPMMISDMYDVYRDNPKLLPLGILGAFGAGVQTYQPKQGVFQSKLKTPINTPAVFKSKLKPFKSKLK